MEKRNKKFIYGFTLIELLGVIVLIAVVAVITIPVVYRVIESSRRNAFREAAIGIIKATDVYFARNEDSMYQTFQKNGGMVTFIFDDKTNKKGISAEGYQLSFTGKVPIGGKIRLYNDGTIEVENLTDGTYYANKDIDTSISITTELIVIPSEELTEVVLKLQEEMKAAKAKNQAQLVELTALKEENATLKNGSRTNTTDVSTNKKEITDIKKQVDNNTTNIANLSKDQLNKIYPVGSVYSSTSSTNPATLFGGTWETYGKGRALVGIHTADANFNTAGKTGGATTINLAHSHTVNSHTHTVDAHSHTVNSHTHTVNSHSHTVNNHTHTVNAHSHTVNAHKHLQTIGADDNYIYIMGGTGAWGSAVIQTWRSAYAPSPWWATGSARLHYTKEATAGTSSASLTSNGSAPGTSGVSLTTNGSAPGTSSTSLTTNGTTSTTNSILSSTQSILQPYITVYMWRRTA